MTPIASVSLPASMLAQAAEVPDAAAEHFERLVAADAAELKSLEQQLSNAPGSLTRIERLGSEQTGFAAVLGLALLPQGKVVRGGVLLLHDSGQHPDWPTFIGPARLMLAADGWHTLSIALSPVRPEATPERSLPPRLANGGLSAAGTGPAPAEPATEAATAPADDAAPAPVPALVDATSTAAAPEPQPEAPRLKQFSDTERVALGLAWLSQQAVNNQVLLGVGLGADTALGAYASLNLGTRDLILVLISSSLGLNEMNELLKQYPSLSEALILDIYDPASNFASVLASGRRTVMQRSSAQGYQQRGIAGIQNDLQLSHQAVLRSLRGWLRRHATLAEDNR